MNNKLKNSLKNYLLFGLVAFSSNGLNAGFGNSFAGGLIGGGLGGYVGTRMAQPSSPQVVYAEQPQPVIIQQPAPSYAASDYYDYQPRQYNRPRYSGRKRRASYQEPAYQEYYDEEDAAYAQEEYQRPPQRQKQTPKNISAQTQQPMRLKELEATNKKLELENKKLELEIEKLKLSHHKDGTAAINPQEKPTIAQAEHALAKQKENALKHAAEHTTK